MRAIHTQPVWTLLYDGLRTNTLRVLFYRQSWWAMNSSLFTKHAVYLRICNDSTRQTALLVILRDKLCQFLPFHWYIRLLVWLEQHKPHHLSGQLVNLHRCEIFFPGSWPFKKTLKIGHEPLASENSTQATIAYIEIPSSVGTIKTCQQRNWV